MLKEIKLSPSIAVFIVGNERLNLVRYMFIQNVNGIREFMDYTNTFEWDFKRPLDDETILDKINERGLYEKV